MHPDSLADGRYELLHELGQGGMATVYRAVDHRLGVERAVKILAPDFAGSTKLRERFHREARLMARLEHPNIVSVHDVGQADGHTYIVMSLLQNGSVHDHIKRFGPMPPGQAVQITGDVLKALKAAHSIGVVHRDIKPHNILIDGLGHARLADFGIAHSTRDATLTKTGALMGTWAYMAPEQRHSAKATDARSDLYAVGAMLVNLLRDVEPHDLHNAESHDEQLAGIPDGVAAFIRTCTRYRPEERYQDADDALVALATLELPPDPPGTPPLGTGWVAAGELLPSVEGETNDTLLAWMDSSATPAEPSFESGPTIATPELDPALGPDSPIDRQAQTVLGAATVMQDSDEPSEPGATHATDSDEVPEPATARPVPAVPLSPAAPRSSALPLVLRVASLVVLVLVVGSGMWASGVMESAPAAPSSPQVAEPSPLPASVPVPPPADPAPQPATVPEPEPAPVAQPPRAGSEPLPAPDPQPVAEPQPPPPPETPDPAPETPPGPMGRVTVLSLPESEVFIDGKSYGRGRVNAELSVGEHTIRLQPGGGSPVNRPLTVTEGPPVSFCWDFNAGAVCSR